MTSGTPQRWVRGEGLSIPSPLLGCHLGRGARTPVSVVARRGQGLRSLSVVGARVCIAVCDPASASALVFGYVSVGKDCAVSPWFWCSGVLPCALVYGYVHIGKDCACLSVVLVLECIAVRVGVQIRPYRQGLRCLSVVLVLVFTAVRVRVRFRVYGQGLRVSSWFGARVHCRARWCADTASGQGLRLSLRGPGARVHCRARSCAVSRTWARIARVFVVWCSCSLPCALVCGYGFWARIALVSPWSWCSSRLRALVADTSFLGGIALVSP